MLLRGQLGSASLLESVELDSIQMLSSSRSDVAMWASEEWWMVLMDPLHPQRMIHGA
jgi:hypothetical protein